ncbi:hemolysin-type calcium-binding repeat 2 copies family protein [Asticcacaulis biprosthecium C19]|uniref:Hemolysin-type calcium-binding repeat 2 copies family protein n=1 Tax=Asticcacaulis biprosthecium C19 TaxID=715226 RepID=F4QKA1_9CAUL|nr:calcium-binding protein [Asticcacaulis biprosthecium]EGF93279.1 hemolysin-type calcium-binding repeat 2 copies family protein [Asticcacaulis biprosthecium C19]
MANFEGTDEHDNLLGTDGDDSFSQISLNDTIDGGSGNDVVHIDLSDAQEDVHYNAVLAAGDTFMVAGAGLQVRKVERLAYLQTGEGDDTLTISGAQGHFEWTGLGGDNCLVVDYSDLDTAIQAFRSYGSYVIQYGNGQSSIDMVDTVVITGTRFDDRFGADGGYGGHLGGEYYGAGGDDSFHYDGYMGYGTVMDGGAGTDTLYVSYGWATTDITFNAVAAATETGISPFWAVNFRNMERLGFLYTGNGNDTLIVSATQGAFTWGARDGTDLLIADYSAWTGAVVSEVVGVVYRITANGVSEVHDAEALRLTGSAYGDTLYGLAGNDSLNGGVGDDLITGGGGHDRMTGDAGADTLAGGIGNDTYYLDDTGDRVTETAGQGNDLVRSTVTWSLAGQVIEDLILTEGASVNGTGNSLSNHITGNSGNNILYGMGGDDVLSGMDGNDSLTGGAGHDILSGDGGDDTLAGGDGNDQYNINTVADLVLENAGQGTDTVSSSITYSLSGKQIENLILTGSGALNATGNNLANALTGNSGANLLSGLAGHDHLNGGSGADTLIGGTGNDTFTVDNIGDLVTEVAGGGADLVQASASFTLDAYVENLILTGTKTIHGTGNGHGNDMTGNGRNNTLNGLGGNDSLTGGQGGDVFLFQTGSGDDRILDFSAAQNDTINVNAYTGGVADNSLVAQVGGNVVITFDASNTITVIGATQANVLAHMVW